MYLAPFVLHWRYFCGSEVKGITTWRDKEE